MRIDDILSISLISVYIVPFFRYLLLQDPNELRYFLGLFITLIVNKVLKYIVIGDISPRPAKATNCNLWANDGKQGGRPGMPSGHSSHISYFVGYYVQQTTSMPLRVLLILYGIGVMISRYTKHCHTLEQILSGSALGFGMSYLIVRHL